MAPLFQLPLINPRRACAARVTVLSKCSTFLSQLRRIFSDFSMFVAILTMVIIAYLLRDKIAVETLVVPSEFQPSCPSRAALGWIINPLTSSRMETWMYFAAFIPAGLVRPVARGLKREFGSIVRAKFRNVGTVFAFFHCVRHCLFLF